MKSLKIPKNVDITIKELRASNSTESSNIDSEGYSVIKFLNCPLYKEPKKMFISKEIQLSIKEDNNKDLILIGECLENSKQILGTVMKEIENIIIGGTKGFIRKLKIEGIGYRVELKGDSLDLYLGFAHSVNFKVPSTIEIKCPTSTTIEGRSTSLKELTQFLSKIELVKPAKKDKYKGKGIKRI